MARREAQDDPLIVVIPSRDHVTGVDDPTEKPQHGPYKAVLFSEAIAARYDTYAHFLPYTVLGHTKWPRINKPCLPPLRDSGVTIVVELTCLDWDTEGHQPWERDAYERFLKEIDRAVAKQNVPNPTLVYKSRAGARVIYQHPPLEPEQAEGFHRYLVDLWAHNTGLMFDDGVWEWNRPHALPHVIRDDVRLDPKPFRLGDPLDSIPAFKDPGFRRITPLDANLLRAELPDPNDALGLVWRQGSGTRLTPWGKAALKRMRGRDAEILFDYSDPPELTKDRNTTYFKWIGSLVSMLFQNPEGTTPEHIWGVLYPSAQRSTRQDGRNMLAECWKMVCYCWAHEKAQHAAVVEDTKTFTGTLRDGVRLWWPDAPDDDEELKQGLRKQIVLAHHHDYYVLQESGLYSPHPVKGPTLIAALRHSGLVGKDRLLTALEATGPKGPTALTSQRALDVFARPITTVDLTGGPKLGGYLDGQTLTVSRFTRRTDLPANYDQRVQDWLECYYTPKPTFHLTAAQCLEKGLQWIAASLAYERGPVAALSVNGPSGIGKDMFGLALAETCSSRSFAGKEIFEDWQYFIDQTPYVWVNEREPPKCEAFDVRLRELIGGAHLVVNQKHLAVVRINASFRVLMTANTEALAAKLFSRRGMSRDEREATELRLLHLDVSDRAARHLRKLGGDDYTRGWVKGRNASVPSEGVVAAHFLWIYENTKLPKPGRFLLDGEVGQFQRGLWWEDEEVVSVGEMIVNMYERDRLKTGFITAQQVLDWSDNLMSNRTRHWNLVKVGRAMAPFCGPRRMNGRRRLRVDVLKSFALNVGLDAPKLLGEDKKEKVRT